MTMILTPGNQFRPSLPDEATFNRPVTGAKRLTVGYELVQGRPGVSFRIRKSGGGGHDGVIPGMDCPMWFQRKEEAIHAAESFIGKVLGQLKQLGFIVKQTAT